MRTRAGRAAVATAGKPGRVWRDLASRRRPLSSLYAVDPVERVDLVKEGAPAQVLVVISEDMDITREKLYATLGVPRATADRKLRGQRTLSQDESERVLGLARLIGQVETIVRESGRPEGFDAAKWVARWMDQRVPALGGRRPAEFMDTAEGRALISSLVARMQTGAYA